MNLLGTLFGRLPFPRAVGLLVATAAILAGSPAGAKKARLTAIVRAKTKIPIDKQDKEALDRCDNLHRFEKLLDRFAAFRNRAWTLFWRQLHGADRSFIYPTARKLCRGANTVLQRVLCFAVALERLPQASGDPKTNRWTNLPAAEVHLYNAYYYVRAWGVAAYRCGKKSDKGPSDKRCLTMRPWPEIRKIPFSPDPDDPDMPAVEDETNAAFERDQLRVSAGKQLTFTGSVLPLAFGKGKGGWTEACPSFVRDNNFIPRIGPFAPSTYAVGEGLKPEQRTRLLYKRIRRQFYLALGDFFIRRTLDTIAKNYRVKRTYHAEENLLTKIYKALPGCWRRNERALKRVEKTLSAKEKISKAELIAQENRRNFFAIQQLKLMHQLHEARRDLAALRQEHGAQPKCGGEMRYVCMRMRALRETISGILNDNPHFQRLSEGRKRYRDLINKAELYRLSPLPPGSRLVMKRIPVKSLKQAGVSRGATYRSPTIGANLQRYVRLPLAIGSRLAVKGKPVKSLKQAGARRTPRYRSRVIGVRANLQRHPPSPLPPGSRLMVKGNPVNSLEQEGASRAPTYLFPIGVRAKLQRYMRDYISSALPEITKKQVEYMGLACSDPKSFALEKDLLQADLLMQAFVQANPDATWVYCKEYALAKIKYKVKKVVQQALYQLVGMIPLIGTPLGRYIEKKIEAPRREQELRDKIWACETGLRRNCDELPKLYGQLNSIDAGDTIKCSTSGGKTKCGLDPLSAVFTAMDIFSMFGDVVGIGKLVGGAVKMVAKGLKGLRRAATTLRTMGRSMSTGYKAARLARHAEKNHEAISRMARELNISPEALTKYGKTSSDLLMALSELKPRQISDLVKKVRPGKFNFTYKDFKSGSRFARIHHVKQAPPTELRQIAIRLNEQLPASHRIDPSRPEPVLRDKITKLMVQNDRGMLPGHGRIALDRVRIFGAPPTPSQFRLLMRLASSRRVATMTRSVQKLGRRVAGAVSTATKHLRYSRPGEAVTKAVRGVRKYARQGWRKATRRFHRLWKKYARKRQAYWAAKQEQARKAAKDQRAGQPGKSAKVEKRRTRLFGEIKKEGAAAAAHRDAERQLQPLKDDVRKARASANTAATAHERALATKKAADEALVQAEQQLKQAGGAATKAEDSLRKARRKKRKLATRIKTEGSNPDLERRLRQVKARTGKKRSRLTRKEEETAAARTSRDKAQAAARRARAEAATSELAQHTTGQALARAENALAKARKELKPWKRKRELEAATKRVSEARRKVGRAEARVIAGRRRQASAARAIARAKSKAAKWNRRLKGRQLRDRARRKARRRTARDRLAFRNRRREPGAASEAQNVLRERFKKSDMRRLDRQEGRRLVRLDRRLSKRLEGGKRTGGPVRKKRGPLGRKARERIESRFTDKKTRVHDRFEHKRRLMTPVASRASRPVAASQPPTVTDQQVAAAGRELVRGSDDVLRRHGHLDTAKKFYERSKPPNAGLDSSRPSDVARSGPVVEKWPGKLSRKNLRFVRYQATLIRSAVVLDRRGARLFVAPKGSRVHVFLELRVPGAKVFAKVRRLLGRWKPLRQSSGRRLPTLGWVPQAVLRRPATGRGKRSPIRGLVRTRYFVQILRTVVAKSRNGKASFRANRGSTAVVMFEIRDRGPRGSRVEIRLRHGRRTYVGWVPKGAVRRLPWPVAARSIGDPSLKGPSPVGSPRRPGRSPRAVPKR